MLENGDVKGVFSIGRGIIAEAGECGRRSVTILLGTLDGKKYKGELLSYEGTLGVGYGVMRFNVLGEDVSKMPQLEEIKRNAIEAGINDPRFDEVEKAELLDLDFSVDVLTEPESCSVEKLDSKEYGVIVRAKGKSGLLLPDLEGVDTVEEQLNIALRKGGIKKDERYSIERFKVIRHKEI